MGQGSVSSLEPSWVCHSSHLRPPRSPTPRACRRCHHATALTSCTPRSRRHIRHRRVAITSPSCRRVRHHRATAALTAAVAPQRWASLCCRVRSSRRVCLWRALAVTAPPSRLPSSRRRAIVPSPSPQLPRSPLPRTRSRIRRRAATSAVAALPCPLLSVTAA